MQRIWLGLALVLTSMQTLEAQTVLKLWPDQIPGPARDIGPEQDINKPTDRKIAGRKIIKLANVSGPEIHVYQPDQAKRNGAAVVICPGGGFHILAWDLEGTEVAEWLNSLGVTAIVLKYRVPTKNQEHRWMEAVQDAQRAMSLVRSHAKEWNLDEKRIGILGFSAGGHTAARMATLEERQYESQDEIDENSYRPDAQILIYPAYLNDKETGELTTGMKIDGKTPPAFIVHAFNDGISVQGPLVYMQALKSANVPSELHVYDTGGHGYGLRTVEKHPVTTWTGRCEDWLRRNEWID